MSVFCRYLQTSPCIERGEQTRSHNSTGKMYFMKTSANGMLCQSACLCTPVSALSILHLFLHLNLWILDFFLTNTWQKISVDGFLKDIAVTCTGASKTKEMIFDFRLNKPEIVNSTIHGDVTEIARKYLGLYLLEKLKSFSVLSSPLEREIKKRV